MGLRNTTLNQQDMKLVAFATLAGFVAADWPPTFWGSKCPMVKGSSKFDVPSYMGGWYNIANSPFFWMDSKNTCPVANYTLNSDGSIRVVNSEIWWLTGKRNFAEGKAVVSDTIQDDLSGLSATNPPRIRHIA